jgi:hypothetical protein
MPLAFSFCLGGCDFLAKSLYFAVTKIAHTCRLQSTNQGQKASLLSFQL